MQFDIRGIRESNGNRTAVEASGACSPGQREDATMLFTTATSSRPVADLAQIEVFAGCTARQMREIDRLVTRVDVAPGRVLCREGELGRECFAVVAGRAIVTIGGRPVGSIERGQFIGEIALLAAHGRRTAAVTAETPMELVVLTPSEFARCSRRALVAHGSCGAGRRFAASCRTANRNRDRCSSGTERDSERGSAPWSHDRDRAELHARGEGRGVPLPVLRLRRGDGPLPGTPTTRTSASSTPRTNAAGTSTPTTASRDPRPTGSPGVPTVSRPPGRAVRPDAFLAELPPTMLAVGERTMVATAIRARPSAPRSRRHAVPVGEDEIRIVFGVCEPHLISYYRSSERSLRAPRNINATRPAPRSSRRVPLGVDALPRADACPRRVQASSTTTARSPVPSSSETTRALAGRSVVSSARWNNSRCRSSTASRVRRDQAVRGAQQRHRSRGRRSRREAGQHRALRLVVLEGELEARDGERIVGDLRRGDVFGETAFLLQQPARSTSLPSRTGRVSCA